MIRRALVAIDGSPNAAAAVTLALDRARRFGIELLGLGILGKPSITRPQPTPLGGGAYKHHRDEALLEDAHRRVLAFLAEFQRRCAEAGVRCAVVEDVGRPHEQIVLEAETSDVVVLGRETHFHFETKEQPDETLSRVLRESPRPVVVVPREPAPGEGVLVAYGTGREVLRTLHTFVLLGLAGDETVDLLAIHSRYADAEQRLERPRALLAVHGLRTRLQPVASDATPAEVILEHVRRLRPRLLVMGAHGHHALRNLFFTSVTRAVLEEAPVPVLVGA
jgi:nucleotide-binding universal stress UspA family protein